VREWFNVTQQSDVLSAAIKVTTSQILITQSETPIRTYTRQTRRLRLAPHSSSLNPCHNLYGRSRSIFQRPSNLPFDDVLSPPHAINHCLTGSSPRPMFSQPTTAPSSYPAPTSPTSPTTSRTGRLRGLSYLRSYTHNHLTSHSSHHSNTPSPRNHLQRSISYPGQTSSDHSIVNGSAGSTQETRVEQAATTEEISSGKKRNQTTSGWLPTVGESSGLSSVAPQPQPIPAAAATPSVQTNDSLPSPSRNANTVAAMTRHRSDSTPSRSRITSMLPSPTFRTEALNFGRLLNPAEGELAANHSNTPSKDINGQTSSAANPQLPTIRFIPHQDPRSARPSLTFPPISRTLLDSSSVIKVGRYSERDANPTPAPNTPSAALVGFKSKVVSRKHCEFWCSNGQWYVKDVKSSSGTFLNHIRLSQPNVESRPYPVNDGDVVQLGIDFRGGEEMIFRCVKIRVECNRAWQKGLNNFKYVFRHGLAQMCRSNANHFAV